MMRMMPWIAWFGILLASGCAPVQPWERGYLARPEMAFDPDPLETMIREHTYTSKETATGGARAGGGGCGCN